VPLSYGIALYGWVVGRNGKAWSSRVLICNGEVIPSFATVKRRKVMSCPAVVMSSKEWLGIAEAEISRVRFSKGGAMLQEVLHWQSTEYHSKGGVLQCVALYRQGLSAVSLCSA